MSQQLPSVLSHLDLPEVELQAARMDGELYSIGECFSPIDELPRRSQRARSLSLLLPGRLIAEQRTAAWIFGAIDQPPTHHQFCADTTARVRSPGTVRLAVREVVIDATDLLDTGGLRVTTPLRTAVDLARFSAQFGSDERLMVRELMRIGQFALDDCATAMNRRRNLPGKQRALERIRQAAAVQPELAVTDAVDVVHGVDTPHGVEHPIEMRGVTHFEDEPAERKAVA